MKEKAMIPSPSQYKLEPPPDRGHNPLVTKSPRLTEAAEIQQAAKKRKSPGVGQYEVLPK